MIFYDIRRSGGVFGTVAAASWHHDSVVGCERTCLLPLCSDNHHPQTCGQIDVQTHTGRICKIFFFEICICEVFRVRKRPIQNGRVYYECEIFFGNFHTKYQNQILFYLGLIYFFIYLNEKSVFDRTFNDFFVINKWFSVQITIK